MDDDDLETTMRHGLLELANDAPRGDGLWETTSSMIAIQPGELAEHVPAEKAPDVPEPAAVKPRRNGLGLGIVIGFALAALLAAAILAVLMLRDSAEREGGVTNPRTETTAPPGPVQPAAGTLDLMPPGPIPAGLVVFNDTAEGRIVVADGSLDAIGLIVPSDDATWRAVHLSRDRTHVFVAPTAGAAACDEVWDLDLRTSALRKVVRRAEVVALSPDGSKAVVQWRGRCATLAGQRSGQVAVRDVVSNSDVVLHEISGPEPVNVSWNPDGSAFAVEPVGTHHVVVYDADGGRLGQFDHPKSSQDGLGWTSNGLILVDLGLDRTAVLRTYDPVSGRPINVVARVPEVYAGGDNGPLVTPQVSAIRDVAARTFVEVRGGAGGLTYAQLQVLHQGQLRIVDEGWYSREFVG